MDNQQGGEMMKPILVVEDEEIMRNSLRDWLTDNGYQVETVEDGEAALASVAQREFDLLILDLRLPGKDGIEVLRQARATKPQLKGIIITAYPSVQTAVEAIKEGAVEYLPKPFDLDELDRIIQEQLGPVQVEIRPKVKEAKVAAAPVAAPVDIPDYLRQVSDKSELIQMLLRLQSENRWLSQETLAWTSQQLGIPLSQVYHIATFYKAFSLVPKGRHSLSVCMGTACHVRGAQRLLDRVTDELKVKPGQTTRDMEHTVNTVNCLGCCALGPVMQYDDDYHSDPSVAEIKEMVTSSQKKEVD